MHLNSIIFSCLIGFITVSRYEAIEDELFKINKLNLVWTKAQHSLGAGKLKDLRADLAKHELDELSLKKMKAHNQDKDGLFEAAVRKKLLSIMTKYKLERYYDDVHPVYDGDDTKRANLTKTKLEKQNANSAPKPTFRDSKLDKLWKKAEKSGFSQEQLMILHEEFEHQQDKLDDHYETMNMIEEEIEKRAKSSEKSENSLEIDPVKESKKKTMKSSKKTESSQNKKARLDENVHQSLKEKHGDVKKGYDRLHNKIATGVIDESMPFEEEQVNQLWKEALNGKFSDDELVSLREELEHYETRIKKLKHFQNQLERHAIGSKESSSNSDIDDETKHIKRRVKDLNQKVDKSYKTLKKKIQSTSRTEL